MDTMTRPKQEGEVVQITLATKRASDALHKAQQARILELERENAWLRIQLRKALLEDDRDIEIVRGCVILE